MGEKIHGGNMRDITPDICDQFEDQVSLLTLPLQNFGQRSAFYGEIVTVRCYHDNSKVREVLAKMERVKYWLLTDMDRVREHYSAIN